MDKETREFLESMQAGMNEIRKEINEFRNETNKRFDGVDKRFDGVDTRFDGVDKRFDGVEDRLGKLEEGQEEIKAILGELEPLNAERHLELKKSIDDLRKDLSTVEIVTSSNYADLAKLKSIR